MARTPPIQVTDDDSVVMFFAHGDFINTDGLTFFDDASPDHVARVMETRAGVVLCSRALAQAVESSQLDAVLLCVERPRPEFSRISMCFLPKVRVSVVQPSALICMHARLGKRVTVAPHVFVDDGAEVGDECVLETAAAVTDLLAQLV